MESLKKIIHIDMDYFFAQVEILDHPHLKDKPVAIGSSSKRGVLCTSNYVARTYGVRSALPTSKALKLCPHLVIIRPHFDKYKKMSDKVFNIFLQFTNKIQKVSIDEAYLDVTDTDLFNNNAIEIAKEIKRRIFLETKLTASAGVSYNKLLAKIGSDLFKPDGLAIIRPENIEQNISHFSVSKINGVGKVLQKKLEKYNLRTFGDLQSLSKLDLINICGEYGVNLYYYCRGVDHREVITSSIRKSLSVEKTFSESILDTTDLKIKIDHLYSELTQRLSKYEKMRVKSIFVKIKYDDFQNTLVESSVELSRSKIEELFLKRFKQRVFPVRLIGMGVKFFVQKDSAQLALPL